MNLQDKIKLACSLSGQAFVTGDAFEAAVTAASTNDTNAAKQIVCAAVLSLANAVNERAQHDAEVNSRAAELAGLADDVKAFLDTNQGDAVAMLFDLTSA
jgi:hypothetical protein